MLQKLKIENFQSHKQTELHFSPGVNIILGTSDSGKTAILRALRWVCQNKPGGDAFRSSWGGDTEVVATFDNCEVTRTKGKENSYMLDDKVFKAFGQDVPTEIVEAINLSDTNLQRQLDAPYLLSSSAGEVAAHFNRMANLTIIDSSLQFIQKDMNSLKSEIDYSEKDIEKMKKSLEKFEDLPEMEQAVEDAQKKRVELYTLQLSVNNLPGVINKLSTCILDKKHFESEVKAEKEIDKALAKSKELTKTNQLFANLSTAITELEDIQFEIQELKDIVFIEKEINKVLKLYTTYNVKSKELTKANQLFKNLERCRERQKTNQGFEISDITCAIEKMGAVTKANQRIENLVTLGKRLRAIAQRRTIKEDSLAVIEEVFVKQFPKVCPLCGVVQS